MKNLLLTGASGFLGWNICNRLKSRWNIYGVVFSHNIKIPGINIIKTDLKNIWELKKLFKKIKPDGLIHTAAISNANYCQENRKETKEINVKVSLILAKLCSEFQIPFAFTSTDLVFDGLNPPYNEESPVSPVSIYGEQKTLAEEGIKKIYPDAAICRMPLMFGYAGPVAQSFIQPMIKTLKEGKDLTLFTDEYRTPASGDSAAEGLEMALKKIKGTIHLGGKEKISRYDFGVLLQDILKIGDGKIIPRKQREVQFPAPRPPDVSLDSGKAFILGYRPLSLREELEKIKNLL